VDKKYSKGKNIRSKERDQNEKKKNESEDEGRERLHKR
jgi:hypothetical protein